MIQFLNPSWLWALTGLMIPIGIHLLSRKEGKTIPIGSLRHFEESVTAQARSLRLNEILLLIVRCAVLTTIVFLLAGIHINNSADSKKRWAVIEAGIGQTLPGKTLLDSLRAQNYSIHYLAQNFPEATDTTALTPVTNYWAALHDLTTRGLNDIVIVSYGLARNFKGQRPALPAYVKWISIPPQPAAYTASAVTLPGDSTWMREARSSAENTVLQTRRVATQQQSITGAAPQETITINVVAGEGFTHDRNIILACLNALQTITPHKLIIKTQEPSTYTADSNNWTIWLNRSEPQTITPHTLAYSPCAGNNLSAILPAAEAGMACPGAQPAGWTITKRLTQATALQENLVLTLAAIILPQTPTGEAAFHDQRVLPEPLIASIAPQQNAAVVKAASPETTGYEYWAILIVILVVAERWLAANRNQ